MKYHELISTLTEHPLLLTPATHASLIKLFEEHSTLDAAEFRAKREGVDYCGDEVELEQMQVIDGIAHIPISGPIGMKLGKFEKGAGAVDVQDIADDIDEAETEESVNAIILDIDSPGGMVSGTPELADRIASCNKPIYAFSSGMVCSAAYWIACACDGIFATKSADIGSIGVYSPYYDMSEAMKARGVKVEVYSSGKFKGAGVPGTSLSEDHKQMMQQRVNEIAKMFYSHVKENRDMAQDEDMQGQVFKAQTAMDKGLIDGIMRDKSDLVQFLR